MTDATSACEKCGGAIRPTGGRSRPGIGRDDGSIVWQPWRESGVCSGCGSVFRRVVGEVVHAWHFTGRVITPPIVHVAATDSITFSESVEVVVRPAAGVVTASATAPTIRIEPAEKTDYGALGFLLAVFTSVYMVTDDAEASGGALALAWFLLTCPATRRAITRVTRGMGGD